MSKLKVGDRVFVTARHPDSSLWNVLGTVTQTFDDESALALLVGQARALPFDRGELEIGSPSSNGAACRKKVYIIGSLRNPEVLAVHRTLQQAMPEVEVFSSWLAAGEHADDAWRDYEQALGRSYKEALAGYAAKHVFAFDKHHLDTSDAAVLVLPAGRSGHLELGYMAGKGKVTAILMDDPERWDVMVQFADVLADSLEELAAGLKEAL